MGAALPLLMKTPRFCHLSLPPKTSPGPILVPMPCDDLREYRRDPATRQSPEVGILPTSSCGQLYGCDGTAGSAVVAAGSPAGGTAGGTAAAPPSPAGCWPVP